MLYVKQLAMHCFISLFIFVYNFFLCYWSLDWNITKIKTTIHISKIFASTTENLANKISKYIFYYMQHFTIEFVSLSYFLLESNIWLQLSINNRKQLTRQSRFYFSKYVLYMQFYFLIFLFLTLLKYYSNTTYKVPNSQSAKQYEYDYATILFIQNNWVSHLCKTVNVFLKYAYNGIW